jgi:undecaprenyl-diphosphatase
MNFLDFFPSFSNFQLAAPITWWHAVILGLVQGLTEFIPVSSSAHLNITHWLLGQDRELTFDVFLHIGTLAALAFYFRDDWRALLLDPAQRKLRNCVFLACVPAAIAGLLLRDLEDHPPLSEVWFNAVMLIVAGVLLLVADSMGKKQRDIKTVGVKDALWVGCSQALALFPGVSRSGATLTMGLLRGLTRADAARFSFLMSLPITLGAVLFEFYGTIKHEKLAHLDVAPSVIALGILVSAASGFWAIGFLLNYLKRHSVAVFVAWRILVALAVFALLFIWRK